MNSRLQPRFVEFMPAELEGGVLYVSMEYATCTHLCACGCGNRVVTPISPDGWAISYDGLAVSLTPSIGNWSFACESHYWILGGEVLWDHKWTREAIARHRRLERQRRESGHRGDDLMPEPAVTGRPRWLRRWLRREDGPASGPR